MAMRHVIGSCLLATVLTVVPGIGRADDSLGPFKPTEAGDFTVRGGILIVKPDASGAVKTQAGADTGININDITTSAVPEVDLGYFFTKNIAAQLVLGVTPHTITTDAGIKVGSTWALPPTLTVQYHFLPDKRINPYVGAGINYTVFFGEKSASNSLVSGFKVNQTVAPAIQFGTDFALGGRWFANIDVKKIWMRPSATTDALKVNSVEIDPWLIGVGWGYRF